MLELEQGRVVVAPHRAGFQIEHRGGPRSGRNDADQRIEVESRLLAHQKSFPNRSGVDRRDGVVDDLDHLSVADGADVDDELPHRL